MPWGIVSAAITKSASTWGKKMNRTHPAPTTPTVRIRTATPIASVTYRHLSASSSVGLYLRSMTQWRPAATRLWTRYQPHRLEPPLATSLVSRPRRWDRWAGRIQSDSTREKRSAGITIIGSTRMIFPIPPGTASMGMKAATVVRTAKTTGTLTSWAPSTAALRALPCRWWWV